MYIKWGKTCSQSKFQIKSSSFIKTSLWIFEFGESLSQTDKYRIFSESLIRSVFRGEET